MRRSYRVHFYATQGQSAAYEALQHIPFEHQARIVQVFERIKSNHGRFDMPFVRHVIGAMHVLNIATGIDVYFAVAKRRIMMLYIRTRRQAAAAAQSHAVDMYRDFMSLEERYEFP